ncbi:MAG: DUF883 domain-containing protein [Burkholderiales bacterium]|jgi:ElaB/YqjD/DUF883 family membrane-anchored ribosome-binding protein|nr:DUF883 domain-containing protein [Burkholderiales bacterium]
MPRSKTQNLAAASQAELENLLADLRTLLDKEEISALPEVRAIRERVEEGIESVRDTASSLAHEAAERAREAARRAKEAAEVADKYAHEEPWRVAGVALGLGALIGFLMSRR